ncbi:Alpha/Beta hydrolase protein [Cercophora newfieldiana]|uniref:Alpha/Beta hydrolase protein n=1 Tax=Cercophora newfieldiana TaxID=92897 RepID=A0AA39XVN5_9PEZI|nr:Alpha/Beta hydrolase protein [Cercophora newfieldiana]
MSKIPTVDGIPVSLIPASAPSTERKKLVTAKDAIDPTPSRFSLRLSAGWWRSLQYVGLSLHFLAYPRPPSPSFTKTIPSTISKTKGEFALQFYTPKGYQEAKRAGRSFPAVINFHGGGFTIGNATDDARFARFVLEVCNAVFVSVDYRLAPEYPFPVAVDDAADSILYLIHSAKDLAIDPHKLATCGFSAGANLALTSTLRLTQHLQTAAGSSVPSHKVRAVATWYPITDYTLSRAERRETSVRPDQTLPDNITSLFDASYLYPPELLLADPLLSPSKATDEQLAQGIPPHVIFYTCEWDMLLREGEELAKRLGRSPIGKDVRYKMIPEVPHAWDKAPDPTKPAAGSEQLYEECCKALKGIFEGE